MSTVFTVLVWGLAGLLVSFVTLVLGRILNADEDFLVPIAIVGFFFWPIAVAGQVLVLVVAFGLMPFINKFDEWAKQWANKLK